MASRLRWFVKKRGTRRTGPRWPGVFAEALAFLALVTLGAYGTYGLAAGMLLPEGARYGWWAWIAMLIPLALVGYGATGLVMLLWQNVASSERRSAVVQQVGAGDWGLGARDSISATSSQPRFPAVPPIDTVIDSAGVRLAYRLPIDAASGWVSLTMAAVCLVWNTLVAIFVIGVIQQHVEGRPNWLLTWLLVPFVLAGAWTLVALVRQVLFEILIGTTLVEVSHHPFYPGGTFEGFISQTGRLHVRWFQVQLVCEEQAVYQQGTDSRRATSCVYREAVFSQRKFDITPQQALEASFQMMMPGSAMHSFVAPHNAVAWTIVVRARTARWGEFERRFPVFVYPTGTRQTEANLLVASARSEP